MSPAAIPGNELLKRLRSVYAECMRITISREKVVMRKIQGASHVLERFDDMQSRICIMYMFGCIHCYCGSVVYYHFGTADGCNKSLFAFVS